MKCNAMKKIQSTKESDIEKIRPIGILGERDEWQKCSCWYGYVQYVVCRIHVCFSEPRRDFSVTRGWQQVVATVDECN